MARSSSTSNQLTVRQQYGLEHLAEHLRDAQQNERLCLLFAGDEWMRMRVSASHFVYSGFVNDLEIAWAAFDQQNKTTRERVTALSEYVRLGLIGSSVTSLSTRPINLLVNAVAAGCWAPARALAVAALNPSVVERIVIYTGLLMIKDLDADTREQIQQLVCRTVAEAPDTIPLRFLARLLPSLKSAAFEVILGQLMLKLAATPIVPATQGWFSVQFTGEDQQIYIDEAISLLEHVPAGRHPPILGGIAVAVLNCVRRVAAEPAAPVGQEGAVDNLFNAVLNQTLRSMKREGENPEVLGLQLRQIAPYVRESQPIDQVLSHVVEALEVSADPVFHELVGSAYASMLDGKLLDRAIARAIELSQGAAPHVLLTTLAPHLNAERKAYVREQVPGFGDNREESLETDAPSCGLDAPTVIASSSGSAQQSDIDVLGGIFAPGGDNINRGAENLDLRVRSQKRLSARDAPPRSAPVPAQQRAEVLARLIASAFPNIDLQQMALAGSPPRAQDESSAATVELQLDRYISRLYAQGELLLGAPNLTDGELCDAAERSLAPDGAAALLETVDQVASLLSNAVQADERCSEVITVNELAASVRRVKGAILRGTLKLAYQGPPGLTDLWQTLPNTVLSEADLSPALEYVFTLPAEVERNLFVWTMHGRAADEHTRCLFLKGLEPLIPHLDPPHLARSLVHISGLTNIRVREQALNLIAPYLSGPQLEQVLSHHTISDAQEQALVLASLAALIPEGDRESVHEWVFAAALEGADGELLGDLVGDLLVGDDHTGHDVLLEQALAHIMRRQPNDQFDALMRLAGKWPDPLPRPLLDAVLRLPAESDRGTFTWRGLAITSLMKRFPEDMLPEVWEAIQSLPPYLHIGEPSTSGWHWSYSYPYAAALHALAPQVTGALLDEAFSAACSLYWKPREEIMQQLAEKATGELAGRLLDHALTMLEGYNSIALSANTLWRDEGAIYTGPMEQFRAERQVAAAELIAALAPKLNTDDLTRVLQRLHLFTNVGPRAWMPGKLLPYVDQDQQKQILPAAVIAAFEFIANDPTRFDLLTALLPFLRAAVEDEVVPIRELTRKYFPNGSKIFLTQEDIDILSPEDRANYAHLTAKHFTPEVRDAMRSLQEAPSDDDRRRLMEKAVLTPLFVTHVEQLTLHLLTHSPLLQRVEALPTLDHELMPDQFVTLVDQAFDELLPLRPDVDNFTDSLIDMLPYIPVDLHQTILEIALSLEAPDSPSEEDLEVEVYGELMKKMPERPAVDSDERPQGRLLGLIMHEHESKQLREVVGHLQGNRGRLLAALLPKLNPSLTAQLINAVLVLPETQRFGALLMLMPHLSAEHRAQVHGNIVTMRSPFGRTLLLWHLSEYFSDEQRRAAIPAALAAVRDLRTPKGQVIALFGLLDLADDDETRKQMLQWILDTLGRIDDVVDRLHVHSLFISMAKGRAELQERAVEALLQFRDDEWRTQQLLIFCKAAESHGDLPQEFFTRARALLIDELHDSAKFKRSSYLRVLRTLCPALKLLTDSGELYLTAKSSWEISTGWNWL